MEARIQKVLIDVRSILQRGTESRVCGLLEHKKLNAAVDSSPHLSPCIFLPLPLFPPLISVCVHPSLSACLSLSICLLLAHLSFSFSLLNYPHDARRLRMNSAHYDKMKELFRRAGAQGIVGLPSRGGSASRGHDGSLPPAWIGDFHNSLFACLMRYEALQVSAAINQGLMCCFFSAAVQHTTAVLLYSTGHPASDEHFCPEPALFSLGRRVFFHTTLNRVDPFKWEL